jgi:TRAP-type uncharacterized transport system substrate-binding protein
MTIMRAISEDGDTGVMQRSARLRLFGGVAATLLIGGGVPSTARAESWVERSNRGVVELMTGDEAASVEMAHELAGLFDDGATRRLLPVLGRGPLQNIIDLIALRGVDMAVVQTDALDHARQHTLPHLENTIYFVAKLHSEELHVLARADIQRIEDLAGKRIDFAGAAGVTGPAVLDLLHVKVEPVFDDRAVALHKLKSGEVAAMAYVAAKPSPFFEALRGDEGWHFLAIPFAPALAGAYVPAQLTSADYSRLVGADAPVATVAVGTVLVVANLPPNTERYRNAANFVDAFFTLLPRLQEAPRQAKWHEVNIAADFPGWRRFPPSDLWLKRNVVASAPLVDEQHMRDVFAKFLDERATAAGGRTLTAEQKGELFDQFRRWQNSER